MGELAHRHGHAAEVESHLKANLPSAQFQNNAVRIPEPRDPGPACNRKSGTYCRISPDNILRPSQMIGAANEVYTADPQRPDTDPTDAQRIGSVTNTQCAATTANSDNETCPGDRNRTDPVSAFDGDATANIMTAAIRATAPYFIARKIPDMIVSQIITMSALTSVAPGGASFQGRRLPIDVTWRSLLPWIPGTAFLITVSKKRLHVFFIEHGTATRANRCVQKQP